MHPENEQNVKRIRLWDIIANIIITSIVVVSTITIMSTITITSIITTTTTRRVARDCSGR